MEKKMSFYEVIDKRRTIRQFDQEEIPKEVLERIINAGLKAPSGGCCGSGQKGSNKEKKKPIKKPSK